jgi:hypothetical protein
MDARREIINGHWADLGEEILAAGKQHGKIISLPLPAGGNGEGVNRLHHHLPFNLYQIYDE